MKILGIDLGITSIGWGLIDITDDDQEKIIDSGVRIFTESTDRSGKTFSAIRREARGVRRVLDRKQQRLKKISALFVKNKLLDKKDLAMLHRQQRQFDVWQLRDKALRRKLTREEWARVLLHIAKRRGYQSNRKAEEAKDPDNKKVLTAIATNNEKMREEGYETIGSMIYNEAKHKKKHARIRRNKKDTYELSISRELLRDEIDTLFARQREFDNTDTGDEFKQSYKDIAFTQRPIWFDSKMIGFCTFEKEESRGPKNSFSVEKSVVLSKIVNTDLINHQTGEIIRLVDSDVNALLKVFYQTKEVKYLTLRKKLKIPEHYKFKQIDYQQNFEKKTKISTDVEKFFEKESWLNKDQKQKIEEHVLDKEKKKLKGYTYLSIRNILGLPENRRFTGVKYDKNPEEEKFGALTGYHDIKGKLTKEVFEKLFADPQKFNQIAIILSYQKDDKESAESLRTKIFDDLDISEDSKKSSIEELLKISFSGFNRLSIKAIDKLLPLLEKGMKYHQATKQVYGHHSQIDTGDEKKRFLRILNEKENYQLTNPTVKRTFSQFRKVVNAIIRKHGAFDAMHIELTRELKNSKKAKIELAMGQKEYREEKEALVVKFKEFFDREPRGKELLKYRLYEQQHCKSIYSTKPIDLHRLLENGYVDIDHILPWSRTFDDSLNNKALCFKNENADKGNKTPFEYLADSDKDKPEWQRFICYVNSIAGVKMAKKNKLLNITLPQRRGDQLTDDDIENPEEGFLARNLNDTAYAARFVKNFVENNLEFTKNDQIKQKVKVRSGALTDQLRHNWGLGEKDRKGNLHHAQDAIILAFATQREVQRMSTLSARREDFKYQPAENRDIKIIPPFTNFSRAVKESIDGIFVSFAPRRKVSGAAHQATIKTRSGGKNDNQKFKVNGGIAEKGEIKRVDVFVNGQGNYKFVPFYPHHFYWTQFPTKDLAGDELSDEYKFEFSLFKDELIEFKRKKDEYSQIVYFKYIRSDGRIAYQQHCKSEIERELSENKNSKAECKQILLSTGPSLKMLKKYQVSVLGDYVEVKNEARLPLIKQMRRIKNSSKK